MSLPPHVKWTLYPVPEGTGGQLRYMLREMITFETLHRFNRRLWIWSYAMHMAMAGFSIFFVIAVAGWLPVFPARLCLAVTVASALSIMVMRLSDANLRVLSSFEELFNLGFLALAAASVWLAIAVHPTNFISYAAALASFKKPLLPLSASQLFAVVVAGLFIVYLPWSKMAHYISKYFTYHKINWQKQ